MTVQPSHGGDERRALDDIDLAAAIAAELGLFVPASPIVVGVTHGVVTLEGEAITTERRKTIEALVRQFAGVREIVNLVTVPTTTAVPPTFGAGPPASE